MTAPTEVAEQTTTVNGNQELIHVVCCDPNVALCGTDVTAEPWTNGSEVNCRLCALAEDLPCGNPNCPDREAVK